METVNTATPYEKVSNLKPRDMENDLSMDIVTITWNDQRWFPNYLKSLINQNGIDLKKINLIVVDNNSEEKNFQVLLDCKDEAEKNLGSFTILRQNSNLGFAGACNVGAFHSKGDLIFFLNIDTELEKDALSIFFNQVTDDPTNLVGAWEFRQFPYEHPKIYDPVTGEISWASGAALIVRRPIFEEIEGFDINFYMYTDDVDISWRIRLEGYKIIYLPKCIVYHYSYQSFNDVKPLQYYYSPINNLQLRFKFGTRKEIKEGLYMIRQMLQRQGPFENSRKIFVKLLLQSWHRMYKQRKWYNKNRKKIKEFHPHRFLGWDYEERRLGDFYYNELPKTNPLVSVVVRTVGRVTVLRETLISLRNQTYKNIEVLVIEDGPNFSERVIKEEFSDLNLKYHSTGNKVGRTKAGNLGLEMSSGEFLAFLDDDDLLYADHFEVLIRQCERNPDYKILHNLAFEATTQTKSINPYTYRIESFNTINWRRFNLLRLLTVNFLPIQAVMFHREVYEKLGGFDESIDVLEDWSLWLKYASKYDYYTVFKTCSYYKVPAERKLAEKRMKKLHEDYDMVRKKHLEYEISINPVKLSEILKNLEK